MHDLLATWGITTWGTVEILLAVNAALVACALLLLIGVRRRLKASDPGFDRLERASERSERALREELAKSREEAVGSGRHLREELGASVKSLGDSTLKQLLHLTDSNEKRLNELRGVVDARLERLQVDNSKKLDEMRATVDEKLQGTLEKRLGEAFQQVSERLEAVHQGLGEMQNLANGVGDLKKMLTNVKTRGTWGEVQLGELLDSILTPDQYDRNVATRRGGAERVEFAIRLPGRDEDGPEVVWLPIDAKFPTEDYQRLVEAEERADPAAAEEARKQLEARVLGEARKIRDKYLNPPATTDFGIAFLPTEGLYAEVVRRPGLVERIQRECRVVIAGPTTLAALLNSLQMGFRTLAIQKRSSEVWKLLAAVKTQFGNFNGLLEKVQTKLSQASNTLEDASRKGRTIERRLRKVQELPEGEARGLLPEPSDSPEVE